MRHHGQVLVSSATSATNRNIDPNDHLIVTANDEGSHPGSLDYARCSIQGARSTLIRLTDRPVPTLNSAMGVSRCGEVLTPSANALSTPLLSITNWRR